MTFSPEQVTKGIMSFKPGSAPGPSGLRAEHLKVAIKSVPRNRTDKAIDAITKLVNVLAAGDLPNKQLPSSVELGCMGEKSHLEESDLLPLETSSGD